MTVSQREYLSSACGQLLVMVDGIRSHTHIEIVWLRPYWNLVRAGDAPVVTSEARSAMCFRNICFPADFIAVQRWEVAVAPCLPASMRGQHEQQTKGIKY